MSRTSKPSKIRAYIDHLIRGTNLDMLLSAISSKWPHQLLCVKLPNHGGKSMVSSQIGYLFLYISEKVALT